MTYVREESVETYFKRIAEAQGWVVRKLAWPGRRNAPDRVLMRDGGRLVFVELKAPKGVLRIGQVREHARLRKLGFRVAVLWNRDQVDRFFS